MKTLRWRNAIAAPTTEWRHLRNNIILKSFTCLRNSVHQSWAAGVRSIVSHVAPPPGRIKKSRRIWFEKCDDFLFHFLKDLWW